MPVHSACAGGWIVVDPDGHEYTLDPLSGERFTEATANQEAAASHLVGIPARAIFRQEL